MSEKEEIFEALAAVINGNPTTEEQKLFDDWLSQSEDNKTLFNDLRRLGNDGAYKNALLAKDRVLSKINERILEDRTRKTIRFWKYVAAASITLFLAFGGALYYTIHSSLNSAIMVETNCPAGTVSKLTLSDGTVVKLNSGTTLRYPEKFTGEIREVSINGEAYFEVAKDVKHQFVVDAGDLKVGVLGTHFNIKAYKDDPNIITSLLEGSVRIYLKGKADENREDIILKPNQQAEFNKNKKMLRINKVNASLFANWKDGGYYFQGERLQEIVRKFERGFNVKIEIRSDQLKDEVFTGVFDKGESITQMLDIMKKHRNFSYRINGKVIVLYTK